MAGGPPGDVQPVAGHWGAVRGFAYTGAAHATVITRTRQEDWFAEECFARFIPYGSACSWGTAPTRWTAPERPARAPVTAVPVMTMLVMRALAGGSLPSAGLPGDPGPDQVAGQQAGPGDGPGPGRAVCDDDGATRAEQHRPAVHVRVEPLGQGAQPTPVGELGHRAGRVAASAARVSGNREAQAALDRLQCHGEAVGDHDIHGTRRGRRAPLRCR